MLQVKTKADHLNTKADQKGRLYIVCILLYKDFSLSSLCLSLGLALWPAAAATIAIFLKLYHHMQT